MNRFAANHPEDWEDRLDAMYEQADYIRKERKENPELYASLNENKEAMEKEAGLEPCRTCGEYLTKEGRTCKRCSDNLEEDRQRKDIEGGY
jgi:hypothetical protein